MNADHGAAANGEAPEGAPPDLVNTILARTLPQLGARVQARALRQQARQTRRNVLMAAVSSLVGGATVGALAGNTSARAENQSLRQENERTKRLLDELAEAGLLDPVGFHGAETAAERKPIVLISGRDQLYVGGWVHRESIQRVEVDWNAGNPVVPPEVLYPKAGAEQSKNRVAFHGSHAYALKGQLVRVRVTIVPFEKDVAVLERLGWDHRRLTAEADFVASSLGMVLAPAQGVQRDPNRRVAEWVLLQGGKVRGFTRASKSFAATVLAELPQEVFTLQHVDLTGCGMIGDEACRQVKDLRGLQGFHAGGKGITDAGLKHLEHVVGMRWLYLNASPITDNGLVHLKQMPVLLDVNLGKTPITDAGLKHLEGRLSLRAVRLAGTAVTDRGLESLRGLVNLVHLDLTATGVTDAGLPALKGLVNLEHLLLEGTKVTRASVEQMQKALPGCKITR